MTEVERITGEIEQWRQKREGVAATLERHTEDCSRLEAQRSGFLLAAKMEGDAGAQAQLEEATAELATAERERRDAGTMLEQIDAKLAELEQVKHAAERVELVALRDQLIAQACERSERIDATIAGFETEWRGWYETLRQLEQLGDTHPELGVPITAIARWQRTLILEIIQWRMTLEGVKGLHRSLHRQTSVAATLRAAFAGHTTLHTSLGGQAEITTDEEAVA